MRESAVMATEPKVVLAKRKAGMAIGGHPWVFSGTIGRVEGNPKDGDPVQVIGGDDGRFIARGLFNSKSDIRVRLYTWNPEQLLTSEFFETRIRSAVTLRKSLLGFDAVKGACRLVFSESDALSGLVVDQYAEYLVVQVTSLGLAARLDSISQSLWKVTKPKGIFVRGVKGMAQKEGLETDDRLLRGELPKSAVSFQEGGVEFEVEIGSGQKTGFYLDQRENRIAVAKLAEGKRVLDLHTYTGGFALQCAKRGAAEVIGVDSSAEAIRHATRHADLNRAANVRFVEKDVFEYLKEYQGDPFDMVILDPPKLAPSWAAKERALRMYHRVNTEALKVLRPEGIFVSCSCSGAVESDEWLGVLHSAVRRSNRWLQVLEVRGASRDHPFSAHCPESRYLKCVIGRVF
jgi:23S rRNA (cytosine1962-C5)-methyltransferase